MIAICQLLRRYHRQTKTWRAQPLLFNKLYHPLWPEGIALKGPAIPVSIAVLIRHTINDFAVLRIACLPARLFHVSPWLEKHHGPHPGS